MALGKRPMSTQGMIPQVCGVWNWEVKLGQGWGLDWNKSIIVKEEIFHQIVNS